jgi:hypothetical protein
MVDEPPLPEDRAPVSRDPFHARPVAREGELILPSIESDEDRQWAPGPPNNGTRVTGPADTRENRESAVRGAIDPALDALQRIVRDPTVRSFLDRQAALPSSPLRALIWESHFTGSALTATATALNAVIKDATGLDAHLVQFRGNAIRGLRALEVDAHAIAVMDWNVLLEALRFAGVSGLALSELQVMVSPGDIQGLRARASEELEPLLDLSDIIRNLARICEQLEPLEEEEHKEENEEDTNMEVDANEADDDMDEEEAIMEDVVLGDVIDVILEDVEMG